MPSTYTLNGGIEKIGLGEKAGAWGTTTNTNFDIIDRLVNGVGAITLSGTTHTLTTSDGSLSDGMYKVLVLGGSPSGTNTVTISPNDADKLYFVKNGTSQTATFTQGSGANVSILAGDSAIIFADGAGSGAAVTDLTSGLKVKGIKTSSSDDIDLDAAGGDFKFSVSDTEILRITNSSSDVIIRPVVDEKDIIFQQRDGTEVARIEDNGTFNVVTGKLAINATAITSTAAELNLLDGGTSVGSSITIADTDGVVVNDGGTMKSVPASDFKEYIMPTGALMPYAGTSAPTGFLLCYGQAISRSTYADLFSAISTTYGTGDGSSTFNLPDLRGRVVAGQDDMGGSSADRLTDQTGGLNGDTLGDTGGSETHTLSTAQMPAHTHTVAAQQQVGGDSTNRGGSGQLGAAATITSSSTGGDSAHNNVQPTIILNYIIRT
jgi:microcystin-dependent protein|tara:strand:- start:2007 stop:3308 length:1302 start_codon:yes stop_codon:yes gene_type:complete